jgi:folate-dependent tRNA-U54 methylase TrmFO/GidA
MNANFGLVDELGETIRDKRLKKERLSHRALGDLAAWSAAHGISAVDSSRLAVTA